MAGAGKRDQKKDDPVDLRLRLEVPPGRTEESLRKHFEIEQEIARRLKAGSIEDRKRIYATMYQELFAQVPDHPRLQKRDDPELTRRSNDNKMLLVRRFIQPDFRVGEFGAGDCRFAELLAGFVDKVYAIDIADQSAGKAAEIENLELVIYDGFDLPLPENLLDLMISDQLLEHLHPDDVRHHFQLVHRTLKPGGSYLLRTPHRLLGPHDISRFFSDQAEGFHLKEWTYGELTRLIREVGFREVRTLRSSKGHVVELPRSCFALAEGLVAPMPRTVRLKLGRLLLKEVLVVAVK